MLKMYHYARPENTILKNGLLGIKKSGRSCIFMHIEPELMTLIKFMNG